MANRKPKTDPVQQSADELIIAVHNLISLVQRLLELTPVTLLECAGQSLTIRIDGEVSAADATPIAKLMKKLCSDEGSIPVKRLVEKIVNRKLVGMAWS